MLNTTSTLEIARSALAALRAPQGVQLTLDDLVNDVRSVQEVLNTWSAVQVALLAQVAAIDDEVDAAGEIVEVHRGIGHTRLDAPALVSDALALTDQGAAGRVSDAVAICSRTPALLDAMSAGALDGWRAGVVATELSAADPATARAVVDDVVTGLGDRLSRETTGRLRARVRRSLHRLDPELVRARQAQARADRDLRRWCDELGLDVWQVRLTPDQARPCYAAVDDRAGELRRNDPALTVGQARADALVDLILGNSTGRYILRIAVPEGQFSEEQAVTFGSASEAPDALVTVTGMGVASGVTTVTRSWLTGVANEPGTTIELAQCTPTTGALSATAQLSATDSVQSAALESAPRFECSGYVPSKRLAQLVRDRDGHCRFPGCQINARFCDLDHVIPWPLGPTSLTNLICLCRRHHRIKQRPRWSVRLEPDGTTTWTDPTGTIRTSAPIDHLRADEGAIPLTPITAATPLSPSTPTTPIPTRLPYAGEADDPAPGLEHALESMLAAAIGSSGVLRRAAVREVDGCPDRAARRSVDFGHGLRRLAFMKVHPVVQPRVEESPPF